LIVLWHYFISALDEIVMSHFMVGKNNQETKESQ
jgi:hypothetical protein